MNKRKIIALALGALLALSGGCSLIDIDEEKAAEIDNAKVLIEYKDLDINKETVKMKMNAMLARQGMTIEQLSESEDKETWDSFRENIIKEMATMQITLEKAVELGLDKLTEDETAKIDEDYKSINDTVVSYAETFAKMAVESDDSLNYDEEYERQVEAYYNMMGYKKDTCRQQLEQEFIFSKVKEHFTKDITVTEEEVKSAYDSSLELQKGNMDMDPKMVETQIAFGGRVLVYPEGYMNVRHILVSFDEETSSAAAAAQGKNDTAEYDKIIKDAMSSIQPKLDDIKKRLEAGEDFAALMDEYNEDKQFSSEPAKSEGVVKGPYSNMDIPGYLEAMVKLTAEGQYTEPVVSQQGAYIIQCVKMLKGEVPYDDVKDEMTKSMELQNKETEWYNVTKEWIDAAVADGTLKMYPNKY